MNIRGVSNFVGMMLLVISLAVAICWLVSIFCDDPVPARNGLMYSSILMMVAGGSLAFATRGGPKLRRRDGFGIVTFGWLFASLFGALPFLFSGVITSYTAAVFETMSGFTTTGASVLTNLESLPRGILLWRATTHLLGGMGVLILCVAILPLLGVGGMHIYRAELPGPSKDRLSPRIAKTAKLLWGVYVLLCIVEILLLVGGGMSIFDSVCHTFATMATGGFSTQTASIGSYNNLYFEVVIMVFMLLAGTNFALHYRALLGKPNAYLRNPEFKFYIGAWLGACTFLTINLWTSNYGSISSSLRDAFFTGTSILTTTGFCTADFNLWPTASKIMLLAAMCIGGCAGSTGGGIKVMRVMVVFKNILREIKVFMVPRSVVSVKLGGTSIEQGEVSHIAAFFMLFFILLGVLTLMMSFFTPDIETAFSSVIATMGNIGPGLAAVGATENYSGIPAAGQAILIFCMLLGRLELYTVLIVLLPSFWKK